MTLQHYKEILQNLLTKTGIIVYEGFFQNMFSSVRNEMIFHKIKFS